MPVERHLPPSSVDRQFIFSGALLSHECRPKLANGKLVDGNNVVVVVCGHSTSFPFPQCFIGSLFVVFFLKERIL